MYKTNQACLGIQSDLLLQLTDYDIFSYYMGDFTVGKLYNSPLRSDDKMPSFAVFKGRRGNLMFKDHGTGQCGTALTFLKEYTSAKTEADVEKELLRIIRSKKPKKQMESTREYSSQASADIGIVRQNFTATDIKYWLQFGISVATLQLYNVFSIKYYLCNKEVRGIYKDDYPMYAFKINDKFKIYRPYNTKYTKWRTNTTTEDVQGLDQLPYKSKLLIITKSLKDVMVLREMGYEAVSPSSETSFIPDNVIRWLRGNYNNIIIIFDRDKTGVKKARDYGRKHNFPVLLVNKRFHAKDISDAVRDNGFDTIKQWLNKELERYV